MSSAAGLPRPSPGAPTAGFSSPELTKRTKTLAMLGVSGEEAKEAMLSQSGGSLFVPNDLDTAEASQFTLAEIYDMHLMPESSLSSPRSAAWSTKRYTARTAESKSDEERSERKSSTPCFYQLVFDIQHCIFKAGNDTICLFSLYDHGSQQYLTEEYTLHLTPTAFPTIGLIDECKVLFCDLTEDMLKKDLYIVCRIYRVGPMDAPDLTKEAKSSGGFFSGSRKKAEELKVVRPFATAVMPLKADFVKLKQNLGEPLNFDPSAAPVMCPITEFAFTTLTFDIIEDTKPAPTMVPLSMGIAYSLTMFKGSPESLEGRYAHYKSLTHINPLAVNPLSDTMRHVAYVSLLDIHVQQRKKKSPCNVKTLVELRNDMYQLVPGLTLGCGPMAQKLLTLETPVYYHSNDPVLNHTLMVNLPTDFAALEKCHLYFTFYHQPKDRETIEERGFAFLPLVCASRRGTHVQSSKKVTLEVYRREKKTVAYLENVDALRSDAKQINVFFRVASTRILADADIHAFVTWRKQKPGDLIDAVKRVSKKSFEELMKMLDEFMMVTFTIMMHTKDKALLEEIFFALVGLLGEVNNTINVRFKPRVEAWIKRKFCYPSVWRILGQQQLNLLNWIASTAAVRAEEKGADVSLVKQSAMIVRHLTKTMRGVQYLFQLMKRSMELEMQNNADSKKRIASEYAQMTRQLFDAMNKLMTLEKPKTVNGVQSYALRGFVALLDGLTTKDSRVLINLAIKFLKSSQKAGVHNNVEKLLLLKRLVEHRKLARADIVSTLLPAVCPLLLRHLHVVADSHQLDEPLACTLILKSCIPLLCPGSARIVADASGTQTLVKDDGGVRRIGSALLDQFALIVLKCFAVFNAARNIDLTEVTNAARIFNTTLSKNPTRDRSVSVPGIGDIAKEQVLVLRDMLVTIAQLARVVSGSSGKASTFARNSDRIDSVLAKLRRSGGGGEEADARCEAVIGSVLTGAGNLLKRSLFPRGWVFMRMLEAEIGMRALSWFGSTLKKTYLGARFSRHLWADWLNLGMSFLSKRDFAIEDMDEERADVLRDNYGDIRQMAIKKLTAAWEQLIPHREDLADIMVRGAVEASASKVPEIQSFAVEVYYQMMKSEFVLRGHLKTVETHTIDQVDYLTAAYSGEPKIINRYLDFFRVHVKAALTASSKRLKDEGVKFLSEISSLYDYLVQLRALPSDKSHEDERASATLELLEYLKRIGKDAMYNRYLHHLAQMHKELQNYTEAGICLQEHAGRLGFAKTRLRYEAQVDLDADNEWRRHVKLLDRAREYFMLGESWEMGVRICQEMARIYEHELFQIDKLPSILQKQAQMWTCINNQSRVFPKCYLVQFRGGGFEARIRQKAFVFKSGIGRNPEGIRDFTQRIKDKYTGAEVVNSPNPIPLEKESLTFSGKYVQITTLQPSSVEEMAGGEFKWDLTDAPLALRQYYRENETAVFTYTFQDKSKRRKGENEFRSIWIVRRFVVAEESIPCRRRRVPVARTHEVEYTPLQTAVNSLTDKTKQLISLVEAVEKDPAHNTNTLSMCLNGILDAAVMGGVEKYREAFFDGVYLSRIPEDAPKTEEFKRALRQQMEEADKGLKVYCKYAPEQLSGHVTRLQECLVKMRRDMYDFLGKAKKKRR